MFLTDVSQVYAIHMLRLPQHMMYASFGASTRSVGATSAILNTAFGCNVIYQSALLFGWKLRVCQEDKISLAQHVYGNLQIPSAVVLRL